MIWLISSPGWWDGNSGSPIKSGVVDIIIRMTNLGGWLILSSGWMAILGGAVEAEQRRLRRTMGSAVM